MDHAAWIAERQRGVGSSRAPMICGVSPYGTPLHAYLSYTQEQPSCPTTAQTICRPRASLGPWF